MMHPVVGRRQVRTDARERRKGSECGATAGSAALRTRFIVDHRGDRHHRRSGHGLGHRCGGGRGKSRRRGRRSLLRAPLADPQSNQLITPVDHRACGVGPIVQPRAQLHDLGVPLGDGRGLRLGQRRGLGLDDRHHLTEAFALGLGDAARLERLDRGDGGGEAPRGRGRSRGCSRPRAASSPWRGRHGDSP
jgi:hypothetical protein